MPSLPNMSCPNLTFAVSRSSPRAPPPSTMQLKPLDNNWPEHIDYAKQAVEVPGTKKPGETCTPVSNPYRPTLRTKVLFLLDANSCVSWWYVPPSLEIEISSTHSTPTAFLKRTSLQDPNSFQTTIEVFEQGLQTAGEGAQCIGYRPKLSDNPPKFADHFVWQTYGEVDTRRRNLGSAIQGLFDSGDAQVVNGLGTIALWSMNIPGECISIADAYGHEREI